jgi:hypothetical protein
LFKFPTILSDTFLRQIWPFFTFYQFQLPYYGPQRHNGLNQSCLFCKTISSNQVRAGEIVYESTSPLTFLKFISNSKKYISLYIPRKIIIRFQAKLIHQIESLKCS